MSDNMKLNSSLTGSAGEYFVAGELSRRRIAAALTMAGTADFDILAVNEKGKHFAIQVKTTQSKKATWILHKKDETIKGENPFYVFVGLNEDQLPEYYIVPAKTVSETISKEHQEWLHSLGKDGKPHTDNTMRIFSITPHDERFYNKWELFL